MNAPDTFPFTDMADAIDREAADVAALLTMLHTVFLIETRRQTVEAPDATIADGAAGFAVLAEDIRNRVTTIKTKAHALYEQVRACSKPDGERGGAR